MFSRKDTLSELVPDTGIGRTPLVRGFSLSSPPPDDTGRRQRPSCWECKFKPNVTVQSHQFLIARDFIFLLPRTCTCEISSTFRFKPSLLLRHTHFTMFKLKNRER